MSTLLTTVVGSYPIPHWLPQAGTREALRDAILAVLKTQENAGIDLISDGELSRFDVNHPETNGMIDYFLRPLKGVDVQPTRQDIIDFRSSEVGRYRREPAAVAREELGEGQLNLVRDWEFVRDLSRTPMKFTCTGPHMLAKVFMDRHYGEPSKLAMALAEILRAQLAPIDASVIQVDEANITGHPEESEWAAHAINHVLGAVPKDAASGTPPERAVHLCFGNYGGQTIQQGHWSALIAFLNNLDVDHVILECARRDKQELAALAAVDSRIHLGVGVVDVKDNRVETPDEIAKTIDRTASLVGGVERIRYIHPDCGFWMLQRSVADRKMEALVQGRDRFLGR
ncbi:MAG: cobalamin-independent methionine synthase II family protein [Planctomycetes bacterium]|nr:cobalamin-independent methionine synthase II family protein [Planctomycetota bacterium]